MIAAANLKRAQDVAETLAATKRLAARLEAMEGVHLIVGAGSSASEIILSPAHMGQVRDDVWRGLKTRIETLEGELLAMGVAP